ncbi:MAG: ribosomal RNA small subunit methyltransferase A [Thermoprotei archaeon]|nr:MAG: ribosomal RNA small subunit methyltransferase A [Thermoprotei archaeon]
MCLSIDRDLRSWTLTVLRKYSFKIKKRLSQHFVVSRRLIDSIVNACKRFNIDEVYEVGTGLGTLTYFLAKNFKYVITVEIDEILANIALKECLKGLTNVDLVISDGVELINSVRVKALVSNAPYGVTGPLILAFLKSHMDLAILVLQYDVVKRLDAKPGSKVYGKITLLTDIFTYKEKGPVFRPSNFIPKPQVLSQLIVLKKKEGFDLKELSIAEPLIKCAFSHRLKLASKVLSKCVKEIYGIDMKDFISEVVRDKRVIQLSAVELRSIIDQVRRSVSRA